MPDHVLPTIAIVLVCLATVALGSRGTSRATSDFYVARRAVSPRRNAAAIAGEYLSGASFLGVAGLIHGSGLDMLWFPVGYTAGYVVLLMMVAAPLRRSGAYTLPDFAEARLETAAVRPVTSVLVIGIGVLYLVPLLQGAGNVLRHVSGAPIWLGAIVVGAIVTTNVAAGGMRAITVVQAMHYWLKLTALAVPAFVLIGLWVQDGRPLGDSTTWAVPMTAFDEFGHPFFTTWSTILGLAFGTMGLPHVLVRFYTNPDGRAARQTTVNVVALLGTFYLIAPLYGALAHVYLPAGTANQDLVVLDLPQAITQGLGETFLAALLAGGAFAAFLATASGLVVSVAGVLDQDVFRTQLRRVTSFDASAAQSFRISTVVAVLVPLTVSLSVARLPLLDTVNLAFTIASSTFAPLLILGIWWRRLSRTGALAGLVVGAGVSVGLAGVRIWGPALHGWSGALVDTPALWSVPLSFATVVVVSLLTPSAVPAHTRLTLRRLHTPEPSLDVPGAGR